MSSTRKKLIALLSKHPSTYISGQYLSEQLKISRTAIWKHMNELKKDGYEIEAKANKGYRITRFPDKLSENTIAWGLETEWLGKKIVHYESVGTTQRIAHDLAIDGATHGTIVIADEQTEGRGRLGRNWYSKKGKGVWMSLILRPSIPPHIAPQLTLLSATVLAKVIERLTNLVPQIKWPNDILIHGKKIAGILTELQAEQDQIQYVIIGIGMNVNQSKEDLPETIKGKPTSLKVETEKDWDLRQIIQEIIHEFEAMYTIYTKHGFERIKLVWEQYGFKLNEPLTIKEGTETWNGVYLGVAEDGALLARRSDGTMKKVYSAEISWFEGGTSC